MILVMKKGDSGTILIRLLAQHIKFEKQKKLKEKISEELMPTAWRPKRWWSFWVSEDEKKEIEPIFTKGFYKCVSVVYMEVLNPKSIKILKYMLSYAFICNIYFHVL